MKKYSTAATSAPSGGSFMMVAALFFAIIAVSYSNTLNNPFIFDDSVILEQKELQVTTLDASSLVSAMFQSFHSFRPVSNLTFALNHYIGEHKTTGYHLVNITLHFLTALGLFLFLSITLQTPALKERKIASWLPLAVTLIWLVNPVHTQSVTYIYQRMTSLAALFFLIALYAYAAARLAKEGRRKLLLYSFCLVSIILAVGSKENAMMLPFFIILYEFLFFSTDTIKGGRLRWVTIAMLLGVVAGCAIIMLGVNPVEYLRQGYSNEVYTPLTRLYTEFRVVIYYLTLLLVPLPSRLHLDYHYPLSTSLLSPPSTLLSLLFIVALLVAALYLRRRQPLIAFGILWYFGNLVIESTIIPLELVYEHRTYLPSMGVAMVLGMLIFLLIKSRVVIAVLVTTVVLFGSLFTYERNEVWSSRVTFWSDNLEKTPANPRVHNNLGFALVTENKLQQAEHHFLEAVRLDPEYDETHSNLGALYQRLGEFEKAHYHLKEAIRLDPEETPLFNLGVLMHQQGEQDEALAYYRIVLMLNRQHAPALNNSGVILLQRRAFKQARQHFLYALKADPNYQDAQKNLTLVTSLMSQP